MSQSKCQGLCGIWGWEEAGESLIMALSRYQKACVFLEESVRGGKIPAKAIASRIDSSLKTLHVKIASELVQSRLALARTRNRISSRFYSLPKKILAQIFMDVVYLPLHEGRHRSLTSDLRGIYSRLHSLLAVCTTWRNVGIAHNPLWAIIPIHDGLSKRLAPGLSLSRSAASQYGKAGIHLAAQISSEHGHGIPLIEGRKPIFDTINVTSENARAILHFLDDLTRPRGAWPTRQSLSELSIYQSREERRRVKGPIEYPDIFYDCVMYTIRGGGRNHLLELFKPLSILRIRGARLLWDQIKFSNRLVELRLQSINFDSESKLLDFLQALNSAPELRDLKIISIIVFPGSSSDSPPPAPRSIKCPVPKLQTLLLQDLDYTALQIIQDSLAAGTYHTTLCLTNKIVYAHIPREAPTIMDLPSLCKVLKHISVDRLVVCGEWGKETWLDHDGLRKILQSLLTVKTLVIRHWNFRQEDMLALERPQSGAEGSKNPTVRFPNLVALYLEEAYMLDAEVLKKVVGSHTIQKMSLSGTVKPPPDSDSDGGSDIDMTPDNGESNTTNEFEDAINWHYFELDDVIVKWLKSKVPQFRLGDIPKAESTDYDTWQWKLW